MTQKIDKDVVLELHRYFRGKGVFHLDEFTKHVAKRVDQSNFTDFEASVRAALHYYRDNHGLFEKENEEHDGLWLAV